MKRILFYIMISLTFFGCNFTILDLTTVYSQFTKDDLSYLHYNKDTLISVGQNIEYKDTITYLRNDTDSIHVKIETKIDSYFDNPWIQKIKEISGRSSMYFNESSGFDYANILVLRDGNGGYSEKFFEVGAYGTWGFSKQYLNTDTIQLDTALVLGKIYQNVYKFYPPEDRKTDIRLIYFAKKYGYIKIEKLDGTKIERIDSGK